MKIEKKVDELISEIYIFLFINGSIFLDEYYLVKKDNLKSRKFKILKKYNRTSRRDNTINENDIFLSVELKKEVLDLFVSKIKVLKWTEK